MALNYSTLQFIIVGTLRPTYSAMLKVCCKPLHQVTFERRETGAARHKKHPCITVFSRIVSVSIFITATCHSFLLHVNASSSSS